MMFIRINMTEKTISEHPVPEKYKQLGNRAIVARIAYDEIPPACSPIGPNNKLIIASSPFETLGITCTMRISAGGKSPLTGGIKESNAGGFAGPCMAKHGIRAFIIEGKPSDGKLYVIHVNKNGMEILDAEYMRGKGTYETTTSLLGKYGDKSAVISIGTAGEQLLNASGIFVNDMDGDPERAAARGGLGAVMGSKGIKAIVIEGDGDFRSPVHDEERFKEAKKALHEAIMASPGREALVKFGTLGAMMTVHALGGMPTKGFTAGTWEEKVDRVNIDKLSETILHRGGDGTMSHSCAPGCIVRCSKILADKNGRKLLAYEYEPGELFGPNLLIDDLDAIAQLNLKCNDYGLDLIETAVTLGVLCHAGIMDWGDSQKANELIDEVAKGTALGKLIGSGAATVGKVFGVDKVPAVKGQAMAAYDPRGIKSYAITYGTTPMGADHTAGVTFRADADHFTWQNAVELSRPAQITAAFYDAYFCFFLARCVAANTHLLKDLFNSVFGTAYQDASFMQEIGKDIIKHERMFNIGAGVTEEWVPEFMREEPLAPHGRICDVPESEFTGFWDEEFWGSFPPVPKRF